MALKIIELQAENIKRLKSVTIRPEGDVVILGGENEQGKSSAFDAIRMVLGGAKATPDVPVRRGANDGRVFLNLGDLNATLHLDASGRKLVVRNADGQKQESPQRILDRLYSKVAFNPLEFATKKPDEQQKILRGLVGLDFTKLDQERKAIYEARTSVGNVRSDAEVRISQFPASCVTAPDEEVSIAALLEEKRKADDHNEEHRKAATSVSAAIMVIDDLEQRLSAARAHLATCESATILKSAPLNTSTIVSSIAGAEDVNRLVRAKRDRAAAVEKFKAKDKEYTDMTAKIEFIDKSKEDQMAKAKWPIPGLGFSPDGVTFDGLPFEAASKAQRMKVSLAIGCALNPELHVLLLEDASLLDKTSMQIVHDMAKERDMQIWLERVGTADAGAIIIEDGEVANYSDEA